MNEPFYQHNESFLQITKWQKLIPNLRAGFTTRNGGISKVPYDSFNLGLHVPDDNHDVIHNRQLLAKKLDFPLGNWVSGEQIHSNRVEIVTEHEKGRGAISYQDSLQGVDGLITNQADILCTAFFADCVPLLFFDPKSTYIGIAHAGWKGTVNRIAEQMVTKLSGQGVDVSNLLVVIGPCISQEAYEVDTNVINHLSDEMIGKTTISKGNNRYLLDLRELNKEILLQCGVLRNNIDVTNYCTLHDKSLFFSHRRDNGKTGRMLGYIGYKP